MDPSAPARGRGSTLAQALPPLALVAAAVLVWHRAIALYFSQDDFVGLARAAGLSPRLEGSWRALSAQLVFDLLRPLAGTSPAGYHLASLAVHALSAVALLALLGRSVGRPAALVGATFFAVHAALFTAVYWIAAIADPLACLFTVLTVIAWRAAGPARWLATPLYALALLAKESALPLPLALLAMPRPAAAAVRDRWRDPVWIALAALAALQAAAFLRAGAMGAAGASPAYGVGLGADLWRNGLTYLGWTANAWLPLTRSFADAQEPGVWGWGAAALALWVIGLASPALRRRGWLGAGAWYASFLIPYLPLASHTYHYYLTLPLVGAAACVAIAADAGLERMRAKPAEAAAWIAAALLAAALAANSYFLVRRIETAPFTAPGHRSDPIVDRALIAERLVGSVRDGIPPEPPVRLAVWTLPAAGPTTSGGYFERNLKIAVYDGLALRVMLPQVAEVRFVDAFEPLDASWRWVLTRPTGDARVLEPAALDSLIRRFGPPR